MSTDRHKIAYFVANLIAITVWMLKLKTVTAISIGETTQEPVRLMITEETNSNERGIKIDQQGNNPEARALFSPRVDYNEWMPVGRGDPLKNGPTYDYSPPALDRVRYWGDLNKDKKEILLLGVSSKRQSTSKKKEQPVKYNSIRRSYFPHSQLPTRLMPPPMQTISPSVKPSSTENYSGNYQQSNSYQQPASVDYWGQNSIHPADSHTDESANFVSFARPGSNPAPNHFASDYYQHRPSAPNTGNLPPRKPWIHDLLQKEIARPTTEVVMQPSKSVYESHSSYGPSGGIFLPTPATTTTQPTPSSSAFFQPKNSPSSFFQPTEGSTYFQPTIPPEPTMTTDSLFSNYNQPSHPLQGPMYLIIEGHSKVKTYGLGDNVTKVHQPIIVPVPVKENPVIKHVVSEDENGKIAEVKHLHTEPTLDANNKTGIEDISTGPSGMDGLLSLLDKSLGNYFLNEAPETTENETESKEIDKKSNVTNKKRNREGRQIFDYDQLPDLLNAQERQSTAVTPQLKSSSVSIESENSTEIT